MVVSGWWDVGSDVRVVSRGPDRPFPPCLSPCALALSNHPVAHGAYTISSSCPYGPEPSWNLLRGTCHLGTFRSRKMCLETVKGGHVPDNSRVPGLRGPKSMQLPSFDRPAARDESLGQGTRNQTELASQSHPWSAKTANNCWTKPFAHQNPSGRS